MLLLEKCCVEGGLVGNDNTAAALRQLNATKQIHRFLYHFITEPQNSEDPSLAVSLRDKCN